MTKSSVEIPVNDLLNTRITNKLFRGCISIMQRGHGSFIRHHSKKMKQFGKKKKNPVKQSRVEVRPSIYFTELKQKTSKDFLLCQDTFIL